MDEVEVTPELLLMAAQDHGYLEGHMVYINGTTGKESILAERGEGSGA